MERAELLFLSHYFDNNGKDGYTPGWAALVMDASGNL
jgi:hypothetical protein